MFYHLFHHRGAEALSPRKGSVFERSHCSKQMYVKFNTNVYWPNTLEESIHNQFKVMTHEEREGPPSHTDLDTFLAALSPNAIAMFFFIYMETSLSLLLNI